jgi:hypothetical protein
VINVSVWMGCSTHKYDSVPSAKRRILDNATGTVIVTRYDSILFRACSVVVLALGVALLLRTALDQRSVPVRRVFENLAFLLAPAPAPNAAVEQA